MKTRQIQKRQEKNMLTQQSQIRRPVDRRITANHSRAVARGISPNDSRAVAVAVRA